MAVIGIENGYPIGTDIKRVKEFYDRGGRYMSLAHNGNNQLADSNTGEARRRMEVGRAVAARPRGDPGDEPSRDDGRRVAPVEGRDAAAIGLSKAPVIASHSSVRKLADQSRNLDDEQLMAMKTNGGVVQINEVSQYIKKPTESAGAGGASRRREGGGVGGSGRGGAAGSGARRRSPVEVGLDRPAARQRQPESRRTRATVKDYVDHIDYAVKLVGIDHVGIASDFDGGGGVDGFNSAAEAVNVTIGTRAPRLHRGTDRENLERQPAAGLERGQKVAAEQK